MDYRIYIDIFSALLTPIIAVIMVYIAYQQWRTNKLKLKKEFYDSRYKVYDGTLELIYTVISLGHPQHEHLLSFYRKTGNSGFLFGKEVKEYLKLLSEYARKSKNINAQIERLGKSSKRNEEKLDELCKSDEKIFSWFIDQQVEVEKKFKKYLDLSSI